MSEYQSSNAQFQNVTPKPGKGKAIASLVLGIVTVAILCWLPPFVFGVASGILGIVFAVLATKAGYRGGIKVGGLVTSIIGLVIALIFFIPSLLVAGAVGAIGAAAASLL